MEFINFKNKKWQVVGKVSGDKVDDHTKLKKWYECDLVLKKSTEGRKKIVITKIFKEKTPKISNICKLSMDHEKL